MQETLVKVEPFFSQNVLLITLNRPEKRNALSFEMMTQFIKKVENVEKKARVLIVQGAGPIFCAGLDLKEASLPGGEEMLLPLVAKCLTTLYYAPCLTIAAVQGAAIAGGAGLMSACDLVVAEEKARFGFPEVLRGLIPALVSTLLRRQVPERALKELFLLGILIDAKRAKEIGLIHYVASKEEMMAEVEKLCRLALAASPKAITEAKKLFTEGLSLDLTKDLEKALKAHKQASSTTDGIEGMKAFLENRRPNWDISE